MKRQLRALYTGTVQGVGFRFTAQNLAKRFQITGYVRNLQDGTVEIIAEGAEEQLRDFCAAIEASHVGSFIREVKTFWDEPTERFAGFEIAV